MYNKGIFAQGLDDHDLARQIQDRLAMEGIPNGWSELTAREKSKGSAVLFLITPRQVAADRSPEPCILLNKRSAKVLQPGDLCCPGGGVGQFDGMISLLLRLPWSPLRKWPLWRRWQASHPKAADDLARLFATGLREGWEEMRLNPLKVRLLGCLPVQNLIMFKRHIYPLVAWVEPHQKLIPNWEVDRIVHIPLRRLLDHNNYGRYDLSFNTRQGVSHRKEQFPCYIHKGRNGKEVLWGATFRITMNFLKMMFEFELPDLKSAPVIDKQLGQTYLNGSLIQQTANGQIEQDDDF